MIQSRHPVCLGVDNTTHFYTGHCRMYIIVPKPFCCNIFGTHRKITYVALLHRLSFIFLHTVSSWIFPSFTWPHQSNKLLHLAHAAPLLKNCPHQTEEGAGPKMGAGDNQPCIHQHWHHHLVVKESSKDHNKDWQGKYLILGHRKLGCYWQKTGRLNMLYYVIFGWK